MPREVLHCDIPQDVAPVWSLKEESPCVMPQEVFFAM